MGNISSDTFMLLQLVIQTLHHTGMHVWIGGGGNPGLRVFTVKDTVVVTAHFGDQVEDSSVEAFRMSALDLAEMALEERFEFTRDPEKLVVTRIKGS